MAKEGLKTLVFLLMFLILITLGNTTVELGPLKLGLFSTYLVM